MWIRILISILWIDAAVGGLQDIDFSFSLRQKSVDAIKTVAKEVMTGNGGVVVYLGHWRLEGGLGTMGVYTKSRVTRAEHHVQGFIVEMSPQVTELRGLGSKKVLILHKGTPTPSEIKAIFKVLWDQLKAPNLLILTVHLGTASTGEEMVYIYNPFKGDIETALPGDKLDRLLESKWSDMNGYSLRVAIAPTYLGYSESRNGGLLQGNGLDGPYLYELARFMNFSIKRIIIRGKGGVGTYDRRTGKYTGTLSQIVKGNAELSLNARFIKWYFTTEIAFTGAVYDEKVCAVVKAQGEIRGWDAFLKILHWQVWAAIFGSALAVNYVLSWMKRIEDGEKKNVASTLPTSLRSMFMIPMTEIPRTDSQRALTAFCLLFGVVVVTTFQAELFSFIKNKTRYKDVNTLEELYDTGLLMITGSTLRDTFNGVHRPKLRGLGSRLIINDSLMTRNWFDGKGVLVRIQEYRLMEETGRLDYGFDLHVVEQCPRRYNLGYVLPRDSPFLEAIEKRFTSRIFEANLVHRWYRETVGNEREVVKRLNHVTRRIKEDAMLKTLSIEDMEVGFFSLLFGHAIGLATFVGELFCGSGSLKTERSPKVKSRMTVPFLN